MCLGNQCGRKEIKRRKLKTDLKTELDVQIGAVLFFFVHFCTNAERKTAVRMEGASDEVPAAVA